MSFRNHGVNRERTDQIALRLDASAHGADVLVLQGGINDIVQGRAIEDAAATIEDTVAAALRLGVVVLMAELLPWNNGWPEAEPKIRALNGRIRDIAARHGAGVLAFHDSLEDPRRPGRMPDALTSDGNHPSVAGYRRLGELAFALPEPLPR